jgi:hypothetical protein
MRYRCNRSPAGLIRQRGRVMPPQAANGYSAYRRLPAQAQPLDSHPVPIWALVNLVFPLEGLPGIVEASQRPSRPSSQPRKSGSTAGS